MRRRTDESGQMLLATGIILMLSLLTMAWYGVSVAGLGDPYDSGSAEVLQVTDTFSEVWQPIIENRTTTFVADGADWQEAIDAAANSTSADLMRHGEHRGVEIILTDISATNNSGVFTITCEVGIADRHARLKLVAFEAVVNLN
jgi:hypothetical protein